MRRYRGTQQGAVRADLVEMDKKKRPVVEKNLSWVEEAHKTHWMSVEKFISDTNMTWDIIYLDPPFAYSEKWQLISAIFHKNLLTSKGKLLIHHPSGEKLPEKIDGFILSDRRIYGGSTVSFYLLT